MAPMLITDRINLITNGALTIFGKTFENYARDIRVSLSCAADINGDRDG